MTAATQNAVNDCGSQVVLHLAMVLKELDLKTKLRLLEGS